MAQYKDGDSRTINGVTYVRQGGQWTPQSSAIGPTIGGNPLIPGQLAAQGPNIQGQNLQNVHTQQQIQAQPLQNENTRVNIAQGQSSIQNQRFNQLQGLRQEFNALPEVKAYSDAISSLGGALKAPDTPQGDLSIVYSYAKAMDPGSVVREGEMDMANSTASQTQQLQQYVNAIQNGKRLPPAVRTGLVETMRQRVAAMRQTYDQQRERYSDAAKSNGFDPAQVVGKPLYEAVRPLEEQYIKAHGETPKINGVPVGFGDTTRNEADPEAARQMDAAIRAGLPYEQASALAKQLNYAPPDRATYNQAVSYAKRNPGYKNSLAEATRTVPTTGFQRFAGSPVGAALAGAGNSALMGFGDEAAGAINSAITGQDYTQARDQFAAGQKALANANPGADLAGQMAGGLLPGFAIAKGLSKANMLRGPLFGARTPLPNLLTREGVVGDSLYGAGYGAGTDNQNRLRGAEMGAGVGALGGIAARGAVNGLASAISPTGGAMRPLYDMGVRPSIGQRMGGAINNFEEKLQSIPLMGDAIAGTRGRAVDQYQIGLFNDSLGHIGQKLPDGSMPGHAPHAFAQDAISKAYDTALSGMSAAVDGPMSEELGALQRQIGTLKPDHQNQFNKIWSDSVARRFQGGQLAGDAYKKAESELSRRVAKLRSNPADGELADALEEATGILRSSALRNSPPESVAALNAADAAHAKLVRIENASRSAGGEPAEFSPKQYATATKNSSGGVRNRQYLRGDALNAELATLGNRLGDKVSNSGSIDRLLAGGALYGLNSVSPLSAATLTGVAALNAPGVRNVVTEAMAPRTNPLFDRGAEELRRRARLAGIFGAPAALDYYSQ